MDFCYSFAIFNFLLFVGIGSNYKNRRTEDNALQFRNDTTNFNGKNPKSGGTRYSRSTTKNAFNSRNGRNSMKKLKEEPKRDDYQDYPADYLTSPVRIGELYLQMLTRIIILDFT